jgi:hypothetical protein
MLTVKDPLLLVLSTPYARKGELYKAHQEYFGKTVPDILVWNADTLSMHPGHKVERFVARKFEADAVVAASEYGQGGHVTFRTDVESFVDPSAVQAVMVERRFELPPVEGTRYVRSPTRAGDHKTPGPWVSHTRDQTTPVLDCLRERVPLHRHATADFGPRAQVLGMPTWKATITAGNFPRVVSSARHRCTSLGETQVGSLQRMFT